MTVNDRLEWERDWGQKIQKERTTDQDKEYFRGYWGAASTIQAHMPQWVLDLVIDDREREFYPEDDF